MLIWSDNVCACMSEDIEDGLEGRSVSTEDAAVVNNVDLSQHHHRQQHRPTLQHQGHSHGHHALASSSIASAAWMVVMGDGLHNFTDGLAIGRSVHRLSLFCIRPGPRCFFLRRRNAYNYRTMPLILSSIAPLGKFSPRAVRKLSLIHI